MEEEERGTEGSVPIVFLRRLGNVVLYGRVFCVSGLDLLTRRKRREDTGVELAIAGTTSMPHDSG